jgi:ubiquinone/menaquinone biosynthesis C-methylase UbiE
MIAFDNEAKGYDLWFRTKLGSLVDKVETDLVMSFITDDQKLRILDYGCGTGNYSFKLFNLGHNLTGYDISENMLAEAKQKAKIDGNNIDFILGDGKKLPFEDDSFDMAVSVTAIEFIENVNLAVSEIRRVVRPGGKIIIGTINGDSSWGELYKTDFVQKETVFKHANFLDFDKLKSLPFGNHCKIKQGLFFPPDTDESELSIELENRLSKSNKGGFICSMWTK